MRACFLMIICLVGLQACVPARTTRTAYMSNTEDAMRVRGNCEFGVHTVASRDYNGLIMGVKVVRNSNYLGQTNLNDGKGTIVQFTFRGEGADRLEVNPNALRILAGNRRLAPIGRTAREAYFNFEPGAYKNITVVFGRNAAVIYGKPLEIAPIRFEYRTESKVAITAMNC